ncbi:dTDP-4-dehydrorhamnose reductase [Succinivibrio sp.]|uniref:dTDP-4-dehydrorhamnose reductase n=1 Tax=Succinivibrio sp. TaxID=2053619 RepID=UPI003865A79B
MPLVLLTGAKGQVGLELNQVLLEQGFKVIACSHSDLDITNEQEISSLFESTKIDLVINSAAYTAVDKAEDEKELCYAVNALGPKLLARECRNYDIPLIHISTDYVYDNNTQKEHTENDEVATHCEYGRTKLFGERFILESGCKYVILRSSWIFGRYGKNFVKAMRNLAKTRDSLKVVADELGNPTSARALAEDIGMISNLIFKTDFDDFGIYNYCCTPAINRNDFAKVIIDRATKLGLVDHRVDVLMTTQKEFGAKAQRPNDSRMSCDKFEKTFNVKMKDWSCYLDETLSAE